ILSELYRREREAITSLSHLRAQLAAARDALQTADEFSDTVERQKKKLDVVAVFKGDGGLESCPVCGAPIAERTPSLDEMRAAPSRLDTELQQVGRDRPQIDSYARRLEEAEATGARDLATVRGQIVAAVQASEATAGRFGLDQRRSRVAGRASFFLET